MCVQILMYIFTVVMSQFLNNNHISYRLIKRKSVEFSNLSVEEKVNSKGG